MTTHDPHALAPLVARARRDPAFLGYALSAFAQRQAWSDDQLAAHFRCPSHRFNHLMLCRCPEHNDPQFAMYVKEIADYVPCDEMELLLALREISIGSEWSTEPVHQDGLFLAARDRLEEPQTKEQDEEEDKPEDKA